MTVTADPRGRDDENNSDKHGDVEGINPRTVLPLAELGRAQAKWVASWIAKTGNIPKVYASPMDRCVVTGQEISTARLASRWKYHDLDCGQRQWQTHDEVHAK